ncbi:HNH endonuclease [Methylovulum psychrotolerans]|uniref:Restriction endonuclease n=1 Tax=Methylovulum psychrotolerans TaxID=1704499 RepID=A0A1Z4C2X8_9GAMM|nr:HNH endonuclease [Methylovulum psychrotolerans]ASF47897.1 restriction endonuclease [Methylovulum psychrotolerans]
MATKNSWTYNQLLIAFNLYCQMPFGKMHKNNPEIIKYAEIIDRTPSALAMKLVNIASIDPAIISTGRSGLKGASTLDRAMWEEMQLDRDAFANKMQQAINTFEIPELSLDIDELYDAANYTGSNKTIQSTSRVGQTFFRRSVLSAYNNRCCITGLANTKLLVASHIVPWRIDETNRLNPSNGLCLSMLHDKAFDMGILTIAENMTISVSKKYTSHDDLFFNSAILAYEGKPIFLPQKFSPLADFLRYHRECIFKK